MTILGVHPEREIPKFAKRSFSQWCRQHNGAVAEHMSDRQVVFFHDTFMEHNHPEIGQAAFKVLEACGYEPIILDDKRCCGRPAVSKGMLDEAKKLARHNIALLAPYAHQGIPIVGCEPSCMAMFVDEYPDFIPGEDAQKIAELVMPLDAFLVAEANAGKLPELHFDEHARRVLFHGHCQQKATFGTESTHALFGMIPNCNLEEIDAGCCGMAGSFGYEDEHYELSIQIAEIGLAPAVRQAESDVIISAMGTSCRDQIDHTAHREALHPIQIFADALL
jgi:Fe-S oxidoreductase